MKKIAGKLISIPLLAPMYIMSGILWICSLGDVSYKEEIDAGIDEIDYQLNHTPNYQALQEKRDKEQSDRSTIYWQKRYKNGDK